MLYKYEGGASRKQKKKMDDRNNVWINDVRSFMDEMEHLNVFITLSNKLHSQLPPK